MKSPITNEKTEETMETKQDQQPLTYPETTVAPWTAAVLSDVKTIIAQGRQTAYQGANAVLIRTYWQVGRRIVEEEQQGEQRAAYGIQLVEGLAQALRPIYGNAYSLRNLQYMRQFYLYFKDLEIVNARVRNLSWTHFRTLLRVDDEDARYWYMREAAKEMWSTRTLDRNIGSQYYYRLLRSPRKEEVMAEMKQRTQSLQAQPDEIIKSPIIAEFLGLPSDLSYNESQIEHAILDHIREFIMEMGRGFAFVARQKRIATDMGDFYVDLVFYNYILKCFFLVDLKTERISHQDVGQMDMYVRMYDELVRTEGDNPTLGLLLCSETSQDIARYSILKDNKQLFASKYLAFLPTEEELKREIERQKELFLLQQQKPNQTS
jgi:hypothetical protein